jgi:hypothetical protein
LGDRLHWLDWDVLPSKIETQSVVGGGGRFVELDWVCLLFGFEADGE